ncbi:MAG: hypothetical protein ABWY07_07460 [Burkholderiales bacterium]
MSASTFKRWEGTRDADGDGRILALVIGLVGLYSVVLYLALL